MLDIWTYTKVPYPEVSEVKSFNNSHKNTEKEEMAQIEEQKGQLTRKGGILIRSWMKVEFRHPQI